MRQGTKQILLVMQVLTWITFIGLCVKTGCLLVSFFAGLFVDPVFAKKMYIVLNLSDLKAVSTEHYSSVMLIVCFLWAMKAYLFYLVINIFLKINFIKPFSLEMVSIIKKMSVVSLIIGALALTATKYSEWLTMQGVQLNGLADFIIGAEEFFFFAGILFIVSLVLQRGVEIQIENELTV